MGDRGNIVIETADKKPKLYFYTHWNGSELPEIVANGLKLGESRWDHDSYLNRILFAELIDGDTETTGYGISTEMNDGGTEVYVCHETKTVRFNDKTFSFQEFIDRYDS